MDNKIVNIIGYEGLYGINENLDIISLKTNRIMTQTIGSHNYLTVHLTKDKKHKKELVHRIIANAFIPNLNKKPQINHKDGDKLNNSLDNLEWCTRKENVKHAFNHDLMNIVTKLSKSEVKEIRALYKAYDKNYSQNSLAKKYNVSQSNIWKIISNKSRTKY